MVSSTGSLTQVLAQVADHLLGADTLVRAVASGRQRGRQPAWRRVELRYVDLKAGRSLQIVRYDDTQAHTSNHLVGPEARAAVDGLVVEPFGNWHVETTTATHQVRVTKKLDAVVHSRAGAAEAPPDRDHNREKNRLLPEDDPVLIGLGLSDSSGRMKPSRQAKYRQVEEFLRILDTSVTQAQEKGQLRTPTAEDPWRIVDLGCGNAYLTFTAQRYLSHVRGLPVAMTGIDVKEQSRDHNRALASELGIEARFEVGSIAEAELTGLTGIDGQPDVVLALHACDTATDEALARAVGWEAGLVLAAPCCHHDVAAQLRRSTPPAAYAELIRHGILRERFADTLTDSLRASLLRLSGYRVEVMQFVESTHTPRNTLLRAVRTGTPAGSDVAAAYDELVAAWGIRPRLADLLDR